MQALFSYSGKSRQALSHQKMTETCMLLFNCRRHLPLRHLLDVMQRLMKVMLPTPGVAHYAALSGLNVVTNASNSNNGTIYCQLSPWDKRNKTSERVPGIINVMQKRIADAGIKDANVEVIQPSPLPGVGSTVGFSMQIEQRSTNDNLQAFEKVVNNFIIRSQ